MDKLKQFGNKLLSSLKKSLSILWESGGPLHKKNQRIYNLLTIFLELE